MNRWIPGIVGGLGACVVALLGFTFAMRDSGRWGKPYVRVQEIAPVTSDAGAGSSRLRQKNLYGGASLQRTEFQPQTKAIETKKERPRKLKRKLRKKREATRPAQSAVAMPPAVETTREDSHPLKSNPASSGNSSLPARTEGEASERASEQIEKKRPIRKEEGYFSTWERFEETANTRSSGEGTLERIESRIERNPQRRDSRENRTKERDKQRETSRNDTQDSPIEESYSSKTDDSSGE